MHTLKNVTSNSTFQFSDALLQPFFAYRMRTALCLYVYPILIFVGVFCNMLSLSVLSHPHLRHHTVSACLSVLCISDSLVLLTSAARYWMKLTFNIDLQLAGPNCCRILLFLEYFSCDWSIWTLLLVTGQRFISAYFPLRIAVFCTMRRTLVMLLVVMMLVLTKNVAILWQAKIYRINIGYLCQMLLDARFWRIYTWIDISTKFLMPFPLMLVMNILIGYKIRHAAANRNRLLKEQASVCMSYKRHSNSCNTVLEAQNKNAPSNSKMQLRKGRDENRRMLLMLLSVNIVFLICYAPFGLYFTVDGFQNFMKKALMESDWASYTFHSCVFQWLVTLIYLSSAVNFFLYAAYGHQFRQTLQFRFIPGLQVAHEAAFNDAKRRASNANSVNISRRNTNGQLVLPLPTNIDNAHRISKT